MENKKTTIIWRLQTSTSKGKASKYCKDHNVAAVGWSLEKYLEHSKLEDLSFDEYCRNAEDYYGSQGFSYDSVVRLNEVELNDLIWMKHEGIYYIARVTNDSHWEYNDSEDARNNDVCNQLTNINWIEVGDESEVPGALTTSFIKGSAFQRIWKPGILAFSEMIYDSFSKDEHKYGTKIDLTQETFYSLISPSDCEDLLYSYLFKNHSSYMCIPSTNKKGTEKYEFVILDTATGKHIYTQVKNGKIDLNADDYTILLKSDNHESEVYLFTQSGERKNEGVHKGIHFVHPDDLFDFACNEENSLFIPPSIKSWIEFAGGYIVQSKKKGIMFDTNDDKSESYMFKHKVIAAWGSAKRFIKSFNQGDYALFYKKGKGIIAIGEICNSEPRKTEQEDGLELSVNMILMPKVDVKGEQIAINSSAIRNLLNKRFFFASTRKVPFLTETECNLIISGLSESQVST